VWFGQWKAACLVCSLPPPRPLGAQAESADAPLPLRLVSHCPAECPSYGDERWEKVRARAAEFEMLKRRRDLVPYSCCFHCGFPQALCSHFASKGQGTYALVARRDCQHRFSELASVGGALYALLEETELGKAAFEEAFKLVPLAKGKDGLSRWGALTRVAGGMQTTPLFLFVAVCMAELQKGGCLS